MPTLKVRAFDCASPWTLRSESLIPNEEDVYLRLRKEHQAFHILYLLTIESFGSAANDRLIADCLDVIKLGGSRDQIRAVMTSLEQKGLVRSWTSGDYLMISLKEKGERVALGHERIEGIARAPLE